MSSKHFEFVAKEVDFTANYTPELRTIARGFAEMALPAIGIATLRETVHHPFYGMAECVCSIAEDWTR
jgi:hypothetical protein